MVTSNNVISRGCPPGRSYRSILLLGAALAFSSLQAAPFQKTATGIRLKINGAEVELAVATPTAFRLSLARDGKPVPAISTFLVKSNLPPWEVVEVGKNRGIKTSFGELAIDPQTGQWTLTDAQGKTLIPTTPLQPVVSEKSAQPHIDLPIVWTPGTPVLAYGCGDEPPSLQQTKAPTRVGNGTAVIPYYWSPNGYSALGVTENDNAPASWSSDSTGVTWHFPGYTADLYLMPAPSLYAAAKTYGQLTGVPPVPPRWSLGYLQSRWGWQDRTYIEDTLKEFHERHLPVDAFIYDFEWYTPHPDYEVPQEGEANFSDFGWNPRLFPQPDEQIKAYEAEGVHFVGIRKPRIGDSGTLKMMRAKGWLLDAPTGTKYQSRDLKFADPALQTWYAEQSHDLLQKPIAGWWNDEGEGAYTTYYHWNEAELIAWAKEKPGQRFWSLNRAFSPGLQRLGAAAWTGDVEASWAMLAKAPTDLLNWGLAGMPYGACDIGGFWRETTPELLTRWMEAGVFFPIMRAHSEIKLVPHFPWLFGPEAESAMRQALQLRYQFIPYYYSLAHETHATGIPLMRPLVMEFPDDPKVANLSDQWLMGRGLMAAPILQPGGKRTVYLPNDTWFHFNDAKSLAGGRTIDVAAALDEIPVYVRAGTILPLGPVIQHTAQLPGGPLEVQVYPGRDATFVFVEDDGSTDAYLKGDLRKTTFTWIDATRTLDWKVEGSYAGPSCFKEMNVTIFDSALSAKGRQIKAQLGRSGFVSYTTVH